MTKISCRWCGLLLALSLLLFIAPACAAPLFDAPQSVTLSPRNARIEVETSARVRLQNGHPVLTFTLPQGAQSLTLELAAPHAALLRSWTMETVSLPEGSGGGIARQRAALLQERDALQGVIKALKARVALWSALPNGTWTPENLEQRETRMQQTIPQLTAELAAKERALAALQAQLSRLPDKNAQGHRLVVALDPSLPENAEVKARYAYTLPSCGWQPTYTINAVNDTVQVRLLANIRQYSGMDWNNTRVRLVLRDSQQRTPPPVLAWNIRKKQDDAAPRYKNRATLSMAAAAPEVDEAAEDAPMAFESGAQAGWNLPAACALPEGVTQLFIVQETWKDSLQRLARPALGDRRVWITARHTFAGKPLPAGKAVFLLDGSAVGEGAFSPANGRVDLYFGADPLLEVETVADTRMSGKSGIINKQQTWKWGWTYTVRNSRSRAVNVRLEEATPLASDESITVSTESRPQASKGENRSLYWDLAVPPNGSAQVRHSVMVSAPQDMEIQPGR